MLSQAKEIVSNYAYFHKHAMKIGRKTKQDFKEACSKRNTYHYLSYWKVTDALGLLQDAWNCPEWGQQFISTMTATKLYNDSLLPTLRNKLVAELLFWSDFHYRRLSCLKSQIILLIFNFSRKFFQTIQSFNLPVCVKINMCCSNFK